MGGDYAHIFGVSDPGVTRCFDSIGFHAIGSGLPHALNTLIARECNQNKSLIEVLLVVYEAKKMAEKAPGVGNKSTDITLINKDGIKYFSDEDIDKLETGYKKWVNKTANWDEEIKTIIGGT